MLVVTVDNSNNHLSEDSLVILVSTDKYLDHVIKLTTAAHAKGKRVSVFFTGKGVLLAVKPEVKQITDIAKVSICDASFRANGLHGRECEVPGVGLEDFVPQAKNAEMLAVAQRHLVF